MEKTVLISCPTGGLDPDPSRWLDSLIRIQNQIRALGMGQAFLAPYRMTWDKANNQIWDVAMKYDFDYILRIDDDVHSVPDDAVLKLIQADKDVIGAAYRSRHLPHVWCALNRTDDRTKTLVQIASEGLPVLEEATGEGVQRVDQIGFGMTLIKVAPFKQIPQPMFVGCCAEVPDDTVFADVCASNGIHQYVHMDVKLWHRDISPYLVTIKKG